MPYGFGPRFDRFGFDRFGFGVGFGVGAGFFVDRGFGRFNRFDRFGRRFCDPFFGCRRDFRRFY